MMKHLNDALPELNLGEGNIVADAMRGVADMVRGSDPDTAAQLERKAKRYEKPAAEYAVRKINGGWK